MELDGSEVGGRGGGSGTLVETVDLGLCLLEFLLRLCL